MIGVCGVCAFYVSLPQVIKIPKIMILMENIRFMFDLLSWNAAINIRLMGPRYLCLAMELVPGAYFTRFPVNMLAINEFTACRTFTILIVLFCFIICEIFA